jgi:hypothetical protein
MRLALILAVPLLLADCAEYYWTKADTTDEQFYKDSHDCAIEASPPRSSGLEKIRVNHDDLYRVCLYARGYRRNKYVSPPTPHWRGVTE